MTKPGRPISIAPRQPLPATESDAMEVWALEVSRLIKQAMRDRGWGYEELAEALSQGVRRSAAVINRRINRGNFNAGFLYACLWATGSALELREAAG
jgi:ribosome-binding protein aMBF1 (putative translation factor)